jgi:hypothetical protein
MTYRSSASLVRFCVHTGSLRTSENDAPFSAEWIQGTVVGFIDNNTGLSTKDLERSEGGKSGEVKEQ